MKKIGFISLFLAFLCALPCFYGCKKSGGGQNERGKYLLEVKYDDGEISGSVTYTFYENVSDGSVKQTAFNLYPNAARGKAEGMTVKSVEVNGQTASFEYSGDKDEFLLIRSKNGFISGDKIKIEFCTQVPYSEERLGKTQKTVNAAYFYPQKCVFENGRYLMRPYSPFGDPFFCDFDDYTVRLTVPSVMTVACGFKTTGVVADGPLTEYDYVLNGARSFAFSLGEQYEIVTKKWGNRSINYYYYDEDEPIKTLEFVCGALNFYEEKAGEYPFETLSFAKSPYSSGGMEYSAFFVVGETPDLRDYLYAAAHEAAHQWFPMCVGTDEYECAYFDEGLAEFLTAEYIASSDGVYGKSLKNTARERYSSYKKNYEAFKKPYKKTIKFPLNEYVSLYEYVCCAYCGGASMFFDLCDGAGKNNFYSALKMFYKKNLFSNVSDDRFVKSFPIFSRGKAKKIYLKYTGR